MFHQKLNCLTFIMLFGIYVCYKTYNSVALYKTYNSVASEVGHSFQDSIMYPVVFADYATSLGVMENARRTHGKYQAEVLNEWAIFRQGRLISTRDMNSWKPGATS